MAKTMNFTIDGKDYSIGFTRETVIQTEKNGFSYRFIDDQPITMISVLWHGAFLANYASLTYAEVEALFEKINKKGLLDALLGLYSAPIESLFDEDEENSKNAVEWTIT